MVKPNFNSTREFKSTEFDLNIPAYIQKKVNSNNSIDNGNLNKTANLADYEHEKVCNQLSFDRGFNTSTINPNENTSTGKKST